MFPFDSFPSASAFLLIYDGGPVIFYGAEQSHHTATSQPACTSQLFVFFIECRDKIWPRQPPTEWEILLSYSVIGCEVNKR